MQTKQHLNIVSGKCRSLSSHFLHFLGSFRPFKTLKITIFAIVYFSSLFLWKGASEVNAQNAYITNSGNDTVKVVNLNTNSIITNIRVGALPYGVAVFQGGQKVYVTNYAEGTVNVINTLTNTVTDTITVGLSPTGISFSPNGSKVYVVNYGSNTVNQIDVSTNTVVDTITVGSQPFGLCFSPNGSFLYVTNEQSNTVSVINTATNTVSATIAVGSQPQGISISPTAGIIYVVNNGDNSISVIDPLTNSLVTTIAVGQSPKAVCFAPDEIFAYVSNSSSDNINVINVASNAVIDTIEVGTNPIGLAVALDGSKLYVSNSGSNTLNVINTATNAVTDTIFGFNAPVAFGNFICLTPLLDQGNLGGGGGSGGGGGGGGSSNIGAAILGQSFTCGALGSLSQVDMILNFVPFCTGVSSENVTVDIYSGSGTSGTLLGTSDIVAVSSPFSTLYSFPLSLSIPLVVGNVYTIKPTKSLACTSDFVNWGYASDNYAGGTGFFNNVADNTIDYFFQTWMVPPAPVVFIPDANFKAALVANASINSNSDNEIQVTEAEDYLGTLNINGLSIVNLTGIEAFTAITGLD
jgi:YVTN family beta-propeller protein